MVCDLPHSKIPWSLLLQTHRSSLESICLSYHFCGIPASFLSKKTLLIFDSLLPLCAEFYLMVHFQVILLLFQGWVITIQVTLSGLKLLDPRDPFASTSLVVGIIDVCNWAQLQMILFVSISLSQVKRQIIQCCFGGRCAKS